MTLKLLVRWLYLWLLIGTAMRLLFIYQYPSAANLADTNVLLMFAAGMLNDTLAFVFAPGLVALLALVSRRLLTPAYVLAMAIMVVVFVVELFFWLEFEGRPDRLTFHYLAYPREVLVFLEDQFFLSLFVLPFAGVIWLLCHLVGWPTHTGAARFRWRAPYAMFLLVAVAAALWLEAVVPVSLDASRIGQAFVSNGYLQVASAARYDIEHVPWLAEPPEPLEGQPLELVGQPPLEGQPLELEGQPPELVGQPPDLAPGNADLLAGQVNVRRDVRHELANKRHVILILEESFAGPVWQDVGLRQKYLPNFVALEQQSLSFTNLYATGSRTTRGMEAVLNGFPPLPGISTTERQHIERLPSLARAMEANGYFPVFLYGGWPGFSNFSNYWRTIGFRHIWSRDDFQEDFETSWGVADEALFRRIEKEMTTLTQAHEHVFLSTLTVSHHRPYDYPDGVVPWPAGERRSAHAMAYADQSLADFLQRARNYPWFADTVFVVVADHGPLPRGDEVIPVHSYRVPLLIHAQGLQPHRFDALGSSIGVPHTLLDMLSLRSTEPFSGTSLLCDCTTPVPLEYAYHIGLLEPEGLQVVTRHGEHQSWRYQQNSDQLLPPAAAAALPAEAAGRQRVLQFFGPAYRRYYGE